MKLAGQGREAAAHYQRASAILSLCAQLADLEIRPSPLVHRAVRQRGSGRPILTHREREILGLIRAGKKNQEIADLLAIGVSTVQKHIQNAYEKLGARNRIEALNLADRLVQNAGDTP